MRSFNHIILGTGQATGTLLGGLLPTKETIAIVEKSAIGGTCVNNGCTPTKALVASARVAHVVKKAHEYGVHAGAYSINFREVMDRMNAVRLGSRNGLENWITSEEHITLYRGRGYFEEEKVIRVGDELITAENIYINVGTRPRIPDIPGLDSIQWLDNASVLELEDIPEHLIIVGGGYIGLEFSQIFGRLGAKVSVLVRDQHVIKKEDVDVSVCIQEILEGEDINIESNTRLLSCKPDGDKGILLEVEQNGHVRAISGSHLLFAIGRIPNSDTINYEAAGIVADKRGYLKVDEYCRTNVDGVFALGDVNGCGGFTHTAVYDAEIVLDYHKGGPRKLSDRIPVYALFCDPPLGRVGLSEKEALKQGYKVLKATKDMATISRAKEMGETQGFAKLLVDAETDLILGASILGPGADEIINMFAAYMYSGQPCKEYRKSMLLHPTISELMPWVLDSLAPIN